MTASTLIEWIQFTPAKVMTPMAAFFPEVASSWPVFAIKSNYGTRHSLTASYNIRHRLNKYHQCIFKLFLLTFKQEIHEGCSSPVGDIVPFLSPSI
ncbi:hypothetical protein AVEN_106665-1 [Araneus ventricosus]|uniref:Uncharacterized protein n=1 Tax=Araneus ventricosus TaxID=182803 RepID=A0A4Y2R398_ARAVE|nr:hypothetical protein AVEN_106665-1 [Araneus ventricosus]